jgi:membrane fusion protein, multidrug efflux system
VSEHASSPRAKWWQSTATRWVSVGVTVALLGFAGKWAIVGRGAESTENAKVEARVVTVSAQVSGVVGTVLARPDEIVEPGAVLMELEARPYELAVARAQAEVAAAEAAASRAETHVALADRQKDATVASARGEEVQASASRKALEAELAGAHAVLAHMAAALDQADREVERARALHAQRSLSDAELERVKARRTEAAAQNERARAELGAATARKAAAAGAANAAQGRRRLAETHGERLIAEAELGAARARVDRAKVELSLAELDLARTRVVAPIRGVVARLTVEPGATAVRDAPLVSLVSLDDVWIEAQFKEGQLARIRVGQRAHATLDAYGSRPLEGVVESISGATTSRFSPLASESAAGNYVKVTQRVPVRIRLDPARDPSLALRPGLSAVVTVDVSGAVAAAPPGAGGAGAAASVTER